VPLAAEVETMLSALASLDLPPIETLPVDQARASYEAFALIGTTSIEVGSVQDRSIPGPAGPLNVRVYRPDTATRTSPVLVWFHGGGFVIGDLNSADPTARALAAATDAVVVSVDYRLAPEARCPAAAEDCYAAACWVADHHDELGIDPQRLALGGDSAGGNLAAVAALKARAGHVPPVCFQLLVYPVTDATMSTPSYRDNAEGRLLTASTMRWFWHCYLGPNGDPRHPDASPLYGNLSGVAPTLIITAEFDPLRDEGEAYGAALAAAGVPATVSRYDGQVHGFFGTSSAFGPQAAAALDEAASALRNAFSS